MEELDSALYQLCYILIISIFNILIFIHFTNQKTLKPSLIVKTDVA